MSDLHFGVPLDWIVEGRPLGTGGAVLNAIHDADIDQAAVIDGDTFIKADMDAMRAPLQSLPRLRTGRSPSMERQLMHALLPKRALRAITPLGEFIDIGMPDDYFRFCKKRR